MNHLLSMTTTVIALLVIIGMGIVSWYIWFPRNLFVRLDRSGGGGVCVSRKGVCLESAPDHYAMNGFDHIEQYVSGLLESPKGSKSLTLFTPDGARGFGLNAEDGFVHATLTVDWRDEPQKEAAIRSFFSSRGVAPTRDYLAGNDKVHDATRVLEYPIQGSAAELALLTKRILQELCGISPTEALEMAIHGVPHKR